MSDNIDLKFLLSEELKPPERIIMSFLYAEGKKELITSILYSGLIVHKIGLTVYKKIFEKYHFTNNELYKFFSVMYKKYTSYSSAIDLLVSQLSKSKDNNIIFKNLFSIYKKKYNGAIVQLINKHWDKFIFDNDLVDYILEYFNELNLFYCDSDVNIDIIKEKLVNLLYSCLNDNHDVYVALVLSNDKIRVDIEKFKNFHIKTNTMCGKIECYFNGDSNESKLDNVKDEKPVEIMVSESHNVLAYSGTSLNKLVEYFLKYDKQNKDNNLNTISNHLLLIQKIIDKLSLQQCVKLVYRLAQNDDKVLELITLIIANDNEKYDNIKYYLGDF